MQIKKSKTLKRSLLIVIPIVFFACQRELSQEGLNNANKPPIANAGPDISILLPLDSTLLDGSTSVDPDGFITEWRWTKIAGPSFYNINNPDSMKTMLNNLTAGVYAFELKVTDNQGAFAKDTLQIIVNDNSQNNRPPVANAGFDKTITLPQDSAWLDGSLSTDPDGIITQWNWSKISGPSSFQITNPNANQTSIKNLVEGIYQFELKVTDNSSLFSFDTVKITVSNIPLLINCVIPGSVKVGQFSGPRADMVSVICNDKFYFAAGSNLDIFDPSTGTVTTQNLSLQREHISGIAAGNIVFFAGGGVYQPSTSTTISKSRIDIYNTNTNILSTAELSLARFGICTATIGQKVFFAGGNIDVYTPTSRVDIYDLTNNTWSQHELSQQGRFVSVVIGNKIWFVTNNSNKIEVYDAGTDSWSSIILSFQIYNQLPVVIYNQAAITLNNKVYFTGNSVIHIYDILSDSWTTITLSENKFFIPAGISNGKIAFIGGMTQWFTYSSEIEIYDPATTSWSYLMMDADLYYSSIISYNNYIYTAGGMINQENNTLSSICKFQL